MGGFILGNRMCWFKSICCIFQILLLGNCFLIGQDNKPNEPSSKEAPAKDKVSEEKTDAIEGLSTNDFLSGKASNTNTKDQPFFNSAERTRISWGSYLQMIIVLTFILILIFLFFYFTKNKFRKNLMGLNGIEVLAKASILPKQTILLVRIGPRVLVLHVTADGNMRTLSEFTNQDEIDQLLSEINKSSRDNIFQSLLTRNQVLYDEETSKDDSALNKIEKETDKIQRK